MIRARQFISELEGTTRGPYAGCVGNHFPVGLAVLCEPRRARSDAPYQIRRRLSERHRTRSGISGNGEQEQGHPPSAVVGCARPPQWLCYGGWIGRVLKAVALAETFATTP